MEDIKIETYHLYTASQDCSNVPELMGSIFIYKNGHKQCVTCYYYKTIFTIMIRKRAG